MTLFANDNYSQVPTTDQLDLNGVPYSADRRALQLGGRPASRRGSRRATDLVVRYEMTWVDFVRKDTLLTGGMVNGIHGELTHRFTERASLGAEYGVRWADLTRARESSPSRTSAACSAIAPGENTTFEAAAGVAHLVDRTRSITRDGPVRASRR